MPARSNDCAMGPNYPTVTMSFSPGTFTSMGISLHSVAYLSLEGRHYVILGVCRYDLIGESPLYGEL
ncbi:hypothetical protein CEXT_790611 [Caerostris extrusa]|uniref:ZP domain-containing protein n=1 Tax=Caerostris extrusa TaxID=172846 RepID=A0AAV4PP69_CAEEX|nr:hypothetical protein CEXT_790611 [Caerostris extrusa]